MPAPEMLSTPRLGTDKPLQSQSQKELKTETQDSVEQEPTSMNSTKKLITRLNEHNVYYGELNSGFNETVGNLA